VLGINLLAHLDGVAAINEDGPLVKGEDGHAPGAGKAGEPAQPFGVGCHILTLKLILPGDDQPGKSLFPEKLPKRGHARFVSHFRSLIRSRDSGKRKYLHPASTCSISFASKTWAGRLASSLSLWDACRKDSSNNRLHGSLCAAVAFHRGLTITQLKDDPMNTGTVKWFNEQKGYGFVQPDNGSKDVFVHISAVERAGLRTLKEGQKVSFEIVTDKRTGKSSAGNLTAT
jgi:CspA family cold shock protein